MKKKAFLTILLVLIFSLMSVSLEWERPDDVITDLDEIDLLKGSQKVLINKDVLEQKPNIRISKSKNGRLNLYFLGQDKNYTFDFDFIGINKIYAIDKIVLIEDNQDSPSFMKACTDWIGPYILESNVSNNEMSPNFTGGWHGSNGDSTGNITGATIELIVFVDGQKITDNFFGKGKEIIIRVTNEINGYNTSYPVINEIVTYKISDNRIDVAVVIKALENCTISRYYGLQSQNNLWDKSITYICDDQIKTFSSFDKSEGYRFKTCINKYILESLKKGLKLEVGLNNSGLGDFEFLGVDQATIFTTEAGKSYFNLVNGKELVLLEGQSVSWSGYYHFY